MRLPCCAITSKPLLQQLVVPLPVRHPAHPHKVTFSSTAPPWQLSAGISIA
jgi:hypothetical protein